MVEAGTFREDLFYRLNVFSILVPPLRARPDDIAPLAHHFLEQFGEELARPFTGFSAGATRALQGHSWPGNIRELRNAVERAAILTPGGEVPAAHVMLGASGASTPPGGMSLAAPAAAQAQAGDQPGGPEASADSFEEGDLSLERMEAAMIRRALTVTQGNKGRAARALGIHRSTLYKKLELYGIE